MNLIFYLPSFAFVLFYFIFSSFCSLFSFLRFTLLLVFVWFILLYFFLNLILKIIAEMISYVLSLLLKICSQYFTSLNLLDGKNIQLIVSISLTYFSDIVFFSNKKSISN